MSSLSASSFGLLEAFKSSLLQLWLSVQDYGYFSIGVILGLIVLYAARFFASPFRKLPPGPRGYPIIGNILEMKAGQWLKFAEWQKKYGQFVPLILFLPISEDRPGDLIYLNAAGQPIVVINSQKVAVELLDRRAAIYSDRPINVITCDIMSGGLLIGLARYGET
jgi:hypothetical protein